MDKSDPKTRMERKGKSGGKGDSNGPYSAKHIRLAENRRQSSSIRSEEQSAEQKMTEKPTSAKKKKS